MKKAKNVAIEKSNVALPKLPHGEETMFWRDETTVVYQKNIHIGNRSKRVAVYGPDAKTAMKRKHEEIRFWKPASKVALPITAAF